MANDTHSYDQINVGDVFENLRGAYERIASAADALARRHSAAGDPDAETVAGLADGVDCLLGHLADLEQYCRINQATCFVLPALSKALAEYCDKAKIAAVPDPHGNLVASAFLNVALSNALDGGLPVIDAFERYQEIARPADGDSKQS